MNQVKESQVLIATVTFFLFIKEKKERKNQKQIKMEKSKKKLTLSYFSRIF